MTPQEFLDEFGTLAEAEGGVQKLRELVLELAVRGKLVEQDDSDEPASDLYKRMLTEASESNGSGKRKLKASPDVTDEDAPFSIPSSWCWLRFGQFLDIQGGGQPPKSKFVYAHEDGYIRLLQIRDFGPKPEPVFVPRDTVTRLCTSDDVMLARYGASVGKVFLGQDGAYNVALTKILFSHEHFAQRFIHLLLKAPIFQVHLEDSSRSAQAGFNKGNIHPIPLPVAPLAEQRRIVAKVDELMGLCDRLEAVQRQRRGVRGRLNRASLERLTSASGAGARQPGSELSAAWQRVCDHFEVLYDTPETLPDLRQTILQLAVQGKLVKQAPNDEPAEKLLDRISQTREELVTSGKLRKPKELPPITDDAKPFELPESWQWTALGNIQIFVNGFAFKSTEYQSEGVGIVRIGDIQNSEIASRDMKRVPDRYLAELDERLQVRPGDLLIAMSGATTGKLGFNRTDETFLLNQRVGKLEFIEVDSDFAHLYLATQVQENLRISAGSAIPNLSTAQINEMAFPVAPLSEQKRIVSKVTDLLSQVTRLESTLTRREATRTQLLTAAIHGLLNDEGHK